MRQVIWLCRHGNRIDFVDPSWKGVDPYLSDDGVIQAKETGIRLRSEGIQHIFASPFLRAVQTAHFIAEALDLPVKIEHGACEWLNTDWFPEPPALLPLEEICERFPRVDPHYQSIVMPHYPETSEGAFFRAGKTSAALAEAYEGDMLIVGHGHSVYGMAWGLIGDGCNVSPGLCALVKIVRNNGVANLELSGDSSHLTDGDKNRKRFH